MKREAGPNWRRMLVACESTNESNNLTVFRLRFIDPDNLASNPYAAALVEDALKYNVDLERFNTLLAGAIDALKELGRPAEGTHMSFASRRYWRDDLQRDTLEAVLEEAVRARVQVLRILNTQFDEEEITQHQPSPPPSP